MHVGTWPALLTKRTELLIPVRVTGALEPVLALIIYFACICSILLGKVVKGK